MEGRAIRSSLFALIALLTALTSGCKTAGYYRQAARGHFQILADRRSIDETIQSSDVKPDVSRKLSLILELREFAEKELRLNPGKHYLDYVELDRRFVVWNVSATPEFSMNSIGWWYPFLGTLTYRGYFDESQARAYGARQRQEGNDVFVGGVEAYSTLGWFTDPALSSFIGRRDDSLAELIFHELAHQKIFVRGDTDFNEAYATAVAQEGLRRWLVARGDPEAIERRRIAFERETQFVSLVTAARDRLEALYDSIDEEELDEAAKERARARKRGMLEQLRADYRMLRDGGWGGYDGYDRWMALPINNAQLNTIDTYYRLVPAFRELIRRNAGDLDAFYREVKRLKRMKKKERTAELEKLLSSGQALVDWRQAAGVGRGRDRVPPHPVSQYVASRARPVGGPRLCAPRQPQRIRIEASRLNPDESALLCEAAATGRDDAGALRKWTAGRHSFVTSAFTL